MDWSLYRCGGAGHVTYAPDEQQIREQLRAQAASGELWRCVRCGTFVPGAPLGSGPVANAPVVRRGAEIRSEVILRFFAVERFLRFLLFGVIAYGIWRFTNARTGIVTAYQKELPVIHTLFRGLGININHSGLFGLFRHALAIKPSTLHIIAILAVAYALVELIESIGLWLSKRWGEYFATVATSLGLPYEIYEIYDKFTYTRVTLFAINLALVLYLILTRRLFGARGGKEAYEARLRSESVFDEAERAAAAARVNVTAPSAATAPAQTRPLPATAPTQIRPLP
jgi:uncharacterized membrane protein (DUF2068 family)